MAIIKKAGIYRVGDKVTGSQIQYAEGAEVADDLELEYVGPFPEPGADRVAEANAKAADEPANKADAAPANKKSNG